MSSSSSPYVVENCRGFLKLYSDGTVFREENIHKILRIPLVDDASVVFKDCIFDQSNNLCLRLYKPREPANVSTTSKSKKLPVLVFFHGGGFCFGYRDWPRWHNCSIRLASGLNVLLVTPDYRLAPEHRLPAAIEDGFCAMKWLQGQILSKECDPWLKDGVDFDNVFVLGDSSGGNMAHHLAVRLGPGSVQLGPVRVRGFILLAPFFGGLVRTKSEEEPSEDPWSLEGLERYWRLSIPAGEDRNHPMVNPFGPNSPNLEHVPLDPILCMVGGKELLRDRAYEYAMKLKEFGKRVEYVEFADKFHGFFTKFPYSDYSDQGLLVIKNFMIQYSTS